MLETLVTPEMITVGASPLVTLGYVAQLLISLAIIIALIYFSAKYLVPRLNLPSAGQMIKIKDRIGIEPQVSAYIISAQEKSYLIVVSNKSVTLIDRLESGS